jgi:hypothetical protein
MQLEELMEHCDECGRAGDHKPCKRDGCPAQAYEDGRQAAKEVFGNFGELLLSPNTPVQRRRQASAATDGSATDEKGTT